MKSNKPLVAILVALILVALCACTASVALFGWTLRDEISQALQNPQAVLDPSTDTGPQADTPVGEEVDLRQLFAPMWEVRQILIEEFYEQPVNDAAFGRGADLGLRALLEEDGVNLRAVSVPADAPSAVDLATQAGMPNAISADFSDFWEDWRKVQYGGVETSRSYEQLMRAALHAAVHELGDPHTNFMDPEELRQADLELEGNYEGIGAWVDTTGEYVVIIAPMEGSPAEEAGLRAGDQVLAIDGEDMTGIDGNVVVSKILGPAGSSVELTIGREDEAPFNVTIVRGNIFVPSVESEVLDGGIAYVQLFSFGTDSSEEIHRALQSVLEQNPSGLIIDLRNNGGGYLDTAVEITSEFLNQGVVLYEDYSDGTRHTYEVEPNGLATQIPLVVLVNQGTASASEILAGAVQDYQRGLLVGETTFGKGSVQISRMLSNNQGALRVTIAHWLTPDERLIHEIGLEPDYVVELTDEDLQAGRDPQLEKAIELLSANSGE